MDHDKPVKENERYNSTKGIVELDTYLAEHWNRGDDTPTCEAALSYIQFLEDEPDEDAQHRVDEAFAIGLLASVINEGWEAGKAPQILQNAREIAEAVAASREILEKYEITVSRKNEDN